MELKRKIKSLEASSKELGAFLENNDSVFEQISYLEKEAFIYEQRQLKLQLRAGEVKKELRAIRQRTSDIGELAGKAELMVREDILRQREWKL